MAGSPKKPVLDCFNTDHLKTDLKGRSVRGGVVTASAQAVRFLLQTGSTMVLARLLTPGDFGLIAMVAVFTGFVGLFKDLGLSMATVQRLEINHAQVNSLFWINFAVGVLLTALSAALAPAVAWFYGEPQLAVITAAIAVTFIFTGLSAQHLALMRRQMRYTLLACVQVSSMLAGIIAAIFLAWYGAGYWALVALTAATEIANTVLVWALSPWRPGWPRLSGDIWPMVRFGGNLTGFNIVNYFTRHMDSFLIGAKWGASPLGIYSKAYGLLLLPLNQVNAPIGAVAIPALSRLQDDPERYRRYYCRVVQLVAYLTMPLVVLLAVLSDEVVAVVLGDQWLPAASIFRIFAFFAIAQSIAGTTGWVMVSLAQADRMFRWGLLQSTTLVAAFIVGLPWGPYGVAMAATICFCCLTVPTMAFAYRKSPVRLMDVWGAVWRPFVLSGLILLVGSGVHKMAAFSPLAGRVALVLAAGLLVSIGAICFWRALRQDLTGILSVVRGKA
jgi:PST family polysaccharide transporter